MSLWIANMMLIGVTGFVAYVICAGVEREQIASMIVVVTVMIMLLSTMQSLTPVIERWSARIDSIQNTADKVTRYLN